MPLPRYQPPDTACRTPILAYPHRLDWISPQCHTTSSTSQAALMVAVTLLIWSEVALFFSIVWDVVLHLVSPDTSSSSIFICCCC